MRLPGILAAILVLAVVPAAAKSKSTRPAAGPGGRVMQVVKRIDQRLRFSRYSHVTRVNEKRGDYRFDCSGMVAWVLRRSAPRARAAVSRGRPLARDFYVRIRATPREKSRWGWRRVARVADARAGDVIAWLRPKEVHSPNTGHVAFIVGKPRRFSRVEGGYLVRIADASQYQHQDDSRHESGRTGFGFGTILVIADPDTGAPAAYGWVGALSAWVFQTKMAIGRPTG